MLTATSSSTPPASPRRPRRAAPATTPLRRELAALAPDLYGRALRMARSRELAEDLVQDTIERAMRFEGSYEQGTNLRAWLHQILFSVFITRCRRQRRERVALASLASDPCAWTQPEPTLVMRGLSSSVAQALGAIPEVFRAAVVLVDLEELTYKDAAARLGVPVGTVMSRLYRGRRLLACAVDPAAAEARADRDADASSARPTVIPMAKRAPERLLGAA